MWTASFPGSRSIGDEPFFVFLHVFDPHSPFRPRPPYDTLWGAPGAKDRLAELEADMQQAQSPHAAWTICRTRKIT